MSTPRIAAVETAAVTLRARPDLVVHGAKGAHEVSEFLLVRVVTDTGVAGYGEVSATPLWSGEDGTTADHLIRHVLAPALVGQPLLPVAALDDRMDRVLAANPFTKAGLSMAMWDALARSLELPLTVLLGGPHRDAVPIKLSLSGDGDVLRSTYAAAVAAGFRAFKVKVGLGLPGDVARMALARELAGDATFLGVDANGGWSRAEARKAIGLLAAYTPAFVEQPLTADDVDGLALLRAEGFPIVADESVFGLADLVRVIRADAADVVSVYVGKAGGPGRAVELGQTAAAFGIGTLIGSNGELGLGAAAQLHVACALPGLRLDLPSDIIGAHYYAEDILATPIDSDGRVARLPAGPGLGVELRDDILALFH